MEGITSLSLLLSSLSTVLTPQRWLAGWLNCMALRLLWKVSPLCHCYFPLYLPLLLHRWLARLHGIEAAVEGITSLSLLLSSLSTVLTPQRWLAGWLNCMALRLLWKVSPLCHCYFPLYLPLLLHRWLARLHGIEAAVEGITSLSLLLSSIYRSCSTEMAGWLARLHGIKAAVEGITSLSLLLSSLSTVLTPQRWLAGWLNCMALRLLWKVSPLCHCYFPLYLPLLLHRWLARLHGIEAAVEGITSLSLLLSSLSTTLAPQRWLARLHGIEAAVEGITSLSLLLSSLSTALAPQRWLAGWLDCMALRLLWKVSPLCHCYYPLYLPLLLHRDGWLAGSIAWH